MNFFLFTCLSAALLIAFYEFLGIARARYEGKTHATGRLILRTAVFVLVFLLFWQHLDWNAYVSSFSFYKTESYRFNNIPYLICCAIIALALVLLGLEIRSLSRARREGRTNNVSRLVTAVVLLVCMMPVLQATLSLWDTYNDKLSEPYHPPLPEGQGQ
ncbi:MAG: hypothetical protein IPN65_05450 [Elusimicrobia bacterium]|jgi:glucan phosphoethanolaminetransferase (alkaline phosphatase superfamily)|nr:hypothetical protein [Elusimicrobiota bacterium]MBK7545328.1 hypothetical protein [Elusimicrobiota bacterium]MBK7575655.1 hypothetical protein [Elusimicrobiota bacterium]MBK7688561.1 hypothetical protein [Elusimicrobiota bacterium]MBK8127014.1 hypothetical protein [Elusimicrobiota bacterium]